MGVTRRGVLVGAAAANRKAVDLAIRLNTEWQVEFLNVLDAQRSLYAPEDALVQSMGLALTDLVAPSKALGGGWGEEGAAEGEKTGHRGGAEGAVAVSPQD